MYLERNVPLQVLENDLSNSYVFKISPVFEMSIQHIYYSMYYRMTTVTS